MPNNISKYNVNDLRDRMFRVMDQLEEGKMDLEFAKTMAQVAQVIVNISKAEIENTKSIGGAGTNFFPILDAEFKVVEPESLKPSGEPKQLNK